MGSKGRKATKGAKAPKSTTTTTTLPKVPAAAEPLLAQLIGVVGTISSDEQHAAALSEQYDQANLKLLAADSQVTILDRRLRVADAALAAAKRQLRTAAIEAYVTGQTSVVDDSLLGNNLSTSSMVNVYASVATGHVDRALRAYSGAVRTAEGLAAAARSSSRSISQYASSLGTFRDQAVRLEQKATSSLAQIKVRLLALVGPKEFTRLLSPMPIGSPYRGPNLAGISAAKVATLAQGLSAVTAARKLLGVPYVWGGASGKGVDCSGLTMLAWAHSLIPLEHSATAQWQESTPVALTNLQPGDLLFYHFADDGNTAITHVVMYVGAGPYGKATVIQAAHSGTNVSYAAMYFEGLVGAGRP